METASFQLSACEAAHRIATGSLTSEDLVSSCLERIHARESTIHAWVYLDEAAALQQARERDASPARGALHGVPIAVKDIIHTADMPTGFGTAVFTNHRPLTNASCVQQLLDAGAVILGKTVTTEFAYFSPGPTTNPHNPGHTPGGSSSGSAAAVADHHVPLSLGTQTAGSIIRPASFNGVFGLKPTFSRYSIAGIQALAPSLDTLGGFARSTNDLLLLDSVLRRESDNTKDSPVRPRSVGLVYPADYDQAQPDMRTAFERCAELFKADGIVVGEVDITPLGPLCEIHAQLMAWEAANTLGDVLDQHRDALSATLGQLIDDGRILTRVSRERAERTLETATTFFEKVFEEYDLLMTLAAAGAAPAGLAYTGDPRFNRAWSLLRMPCLSIPASQTQTGLPLGVQLVGPYGGDRQLLTYASYLQGLIGQPVEIPNAANRSMHR